jgi:hypothetical protein
MWHFRLLMIPTLFGAVCSLAAAAPGISDAAPPQLASHKAIYDLNLVEGEGTKTPASASGRIAYDFSSACEGYAQTLRQVVDMQPQEGDRQVTETRTSTYEDAKGADFRFNIASPGGKGVEVDGHAERTSAGALAIALNRPQPAKLSAGQDVLFPTQHIAKLIQAAKAGEKVVLARVYDGSEDGQKIFAVTAIIGNAETKSDPDKGAQSPLLRGLRRWPVALAYFPAYLRDGTPDYVLSFNLYENGVSSGLKLDYGDFVLTGELTGIEFPAAAKCRH